MISAVNKRLKTPTGKRFKRFIAAAAIAVASSQITLTVCLGVFRLPAGVSGFLAWFAGAAASYVMSRWAWERKGRPHLLKETLPFWGIAAVVAVVLTTVTKLANDLALSLGLSHAQRVLFVDIAFLLANCITFVTRFFIFHYILFADKSPAKTSKPSTSDNANTAQAVKLSSGLRKALILVSPLIIYVLISCLYLRPGALSGLRSDIFNSSPDPQQFVWFLNWWPFALTHHLNPFISKFVWYPHGYNFAWATSIPTLAYLMAPITLTGGAVLSYNLIVLLAPPLGALTCFFLVYSITKRYWPSLIGGYIYGFSSFVIAQLAGHPQVYVNFLLPLIVLLGWRYFNRKTGTATFVILSGILLALQFGVATEVFATFIVFATIALVVFYVLSDDKVKARLAELGVRFYGAVALSLVIMSPYLYYIAKGYKALPKVIHSLTVFSTDALNFVVPTPVTQIGGHQALTLTQYFTGNFSEDGAYIGLPLLVILAYILLKYWQKSYMLALCVLLFLIALFSMGPRLHIRGHSGHIVGIPLPWVIPAQFPLIKSAQPDRFSMYLFLVIAVIIGLWLSYKTTRRNLIAKYGAVLVGVACIVPATSQFHWVKMPVPTVFNKNYVARFIPKNSNVIILPYSHLGQDMYYQYESGMWFTQAGGYVGAIPKAYVKNPVIASFLSGVPNPNFSQELKQFCADNKASKIIYMPTTTPALVQVINDLGWPTHTVGDATVVSVPSN